MSSKHYEVVIVGGGPAGLCSALWLARYLHKVVVVDSGDPRNWETRGINGYLGHQGIRSPELRTLGRAECAKFGVEFVDGIVDHAINEAGELFEIRLRDGATIESRRILLAIGIKDYWPDIPGLDRCEGGSSDVYRFVFEERSTGPISMCVTYTAVYTGNGTDEIHFESTGAPDDNTDVKGVVRLERVDADHTRVTVSQMLAPDTPVPRLLQSLIKSYVQGEATKAASDYLANVAQRLGAARG